MNLFKTPLHFRVAHLNPLIYPTLLGDIHFQLVVNGKRIEKVTPLETVCFQKTTVSSWDLENCRVEFLRTDFKPNIPSSMHVDSCVAGIWRIKCLSKEALPVFRAILNFNSLVESDATSDSGEGLVSIAFESADMHLSIGTEDEESLNNRAMIEQGLPKHFSGNILSSSIKSLNDGLEVSLPLLQVNDYIQVQFIAALSSKKHHKDSCWFAVEQSSEYILNTAGFV